LGPKAVYIASDLKARAELTSLARKKRYVMVSFRKQMNLRMDVEGERLRVGSVVAAEMDEFDGQMRITGFENGGRIAILGDLYGRASQVVKVNCSYLVRVSY
jgi:hypothetical protein